MSNQQSIKSIIDGRDMNTGELEYDWQEFVIKRHDRIERKKDTTSSFKIVEKLLDQIDNNELADNIRNAILNREGDIIYINYNRGFLDSLRLGLMFDKY